MNLLHLEDSVHDAELVARLIQREWPQSRCQRVAAREEFVAALTTAEFDLIISDFSMPGFDGLTALKLTRESFPAKPFIFFSGTIGEQRALAARTIGATDCVSKDQPDLIVAAIRRALAPAEVDPRARPPASRQMTDGAGRGILLIDDDPGVRGILQLLLENEGYRVFPAIDGADALEQFQLNRSQIDLAISDMTMPRMDGLTAIGLLRKLAPKLNVIAISGMMDSHSARLGKTPGPEIIGFSKPITTDKFLSAVREVLARVS